jgi:type VI secretion system protein ImpA
MVPMVSARTVGRFSLRDLSIANGELPPSPDEEPVKFSTIEAAFMECDLEELKRNAAAVRECLDHAEAIEAALTDQVGAANAVGLDRLRGTLRELRTVMNEYVGRRDFSVSEELPVDGEAAAAGPGQAPAGRLTGEIRSREDVLAALDKICQYYDRWEPSSPLPLLLRRAKRLASKSFLEIVRDLTPEALGQVEALGGVDHAESDE